MRLKNGLTLLFFVGSAFTALLWLGHPASIEAASPKSTPTVQTPAATPQYGGVLKVIESLLSMRSFGYPPQMGPIDWFCAMPAVEGLTAYPEKGTTPGPLLATSWKYSPDYKSLTLTLRKGVKFHDGTDFNAQAVKYNLTANKTSRVELASVISIDVIDDYTVRLNLSRYSNLLLKHLGSIPGFMVSPTAVERNGKEWATTNPVGTGPFKFVSYQRQASLKYEKFSGYWDKGKPYLDGVEFVFIADPTVARMSFEKGEAHIVLPAIRDARDLVSKGYQLINSPTAGFQLGGDSVNPDSVYANRKVREAIEYAIDKEAITKALGYGFWEPAHQYCYPTFVGHNPNIKGRPYNPTKAKQLLSEAGHASGFKTKIIVRTGPESDAWVVVQRYLRDVGIDAELDVADPGRHLAATYQGWKNCLLFLPITPSDPNYDVYQQVLASTRKMYVSIQRPPGWDDLLGRALAATDPASVRSAAQDLTKMVHDEAMVIPLWWELKPAISQKSVHDNDILKFNSRFRWTPANTWLSR